MNTFSRIWHPVFTNDLDAYIPEVWAQESLMVLEANMVVANMVHRDFSNEIAKFGDVVNTRRPAAFTMAKKVDGDNVVAQDATATNVPVLLDNWGYVTFVIRDGEETKGFKNLRETFLVPAVSAMAKGIDQTLLYQMYDFYPNYVSKLGTSLGKSVLITAREKLTAQLCPLEGRNLIVTPNGEGGLLNEEQFTAADKIGDEGTAMREGSLGRRMGFNIFTCQNAPSFAASAVTTVTGAVNLAAGYAVGAGVSADIVVDGFSAAIAAGTFCTIAGDMTPHVITATTGGATPTGIRISPGLAYPVADDAVVTVYTPATVNNADGYAIGYNKSMTVAANTAIPGRGVSPYVAATTLANLKKYGLMSGSTTTAMLLNRSLEAALTNTQVLGLWPAGDYNFAFHRNAIALVSRPLVQPAAGAGALSYVASYKGIGLRVTISYDAVAQGHRVTIDFLYGLKTLDTNLGCIVLA